MNALRTTPLDRWIKDRIGLSPERRLTRDEVSRYQLKKLGHVLAYASRRSPFYRRRLSAGSGPKAADVEGFAALPFTTAEDLARDPLEFLCVSHSEVARVVTLRSSGTTGFPKRLFFDRTDLDLTVDFFHHGMSTLTQVGQRVLVLMPGGLPGSVGDLLARGLDRMGAEAVVHGPVQAPEDAIDAILAHRTQVLVGIPVQVLSLVKHPRSVRIPPGLIQNVLLSTDYIPVAIVAAIRQAWGCGVYQHYGMTETGYGGGVECDAHDGYHLREADLFVEVVDPQTGRILPDGVTGEVVVTTLTHRAMPLIRYRTGDLARRLPDYCPCGSALRRLGKVAGRLQNAAPLGPGSHLGMAALDETLFAIPEVLNFQAEIIPVNGAARLRVSVHCDPGRFTDTLVQVHAALARLPAVRDAAARGLLEIDPVRLTPENWFTTGAAKRTLSDRRQERSTA
jgi:phenylacetate-coenzyme A ligase PaaK-like adenylate-forming protein